MHWQNMMSRELEHTKDIRSKPSALTYRTIFGIKYSNTARWDQKQFTEFSKTLTTWQENFSVRSSKKYFSPYDFNNITWGHRRKWHSVTLLSCCKKTVQEGCGIWDDDKYTMAFCICLCLLCAPLHIIKHWDAYPALRRSWQHRGQCAY